MDVIYVGQLAPAWGIREDAFSQFPQIWRVLNLFLIWANFAQKKKILKTEQKSNSEIGVWPLYIYPRFYIGFIPYDIWPVFDVVMSY